jgi:hypothetical protein
MPGADRASLLLGMSQQDKLPFPATASRRTGGRALESSISGDCDGSRRDADGGDGGLRIVDIATRLG